MEDRQQLHTLRELQSIQAINPPAWHSWGSPIGLSIFFWTLVGIAATIKIAFFG